MKLLVIMLWYLVNFLIVKDDNVQKYYTALFYAS